MCALFPVPWNWKVLKRKVSLSGNTELPYTDWMGRGQKWVYVGKEDVVAGMMAAWADGEW